MASVFQLRKGYIQLSSALNLPMLPKSGDLTSLKRLLLRKEYNDVHPSLSSMTSKHHLMSLAILPLMTELELHDILFFIRCFKQPDKWQAFQIQSFINFSIPAPGG